MNDLEFIILETIHSQPFQEITLKTLYDLNKGNPNIIKSIMDDLIILGYIQPVICYDKFTLTKPGLEALRKAQQERNKTAKQESQQRFHKKISIANLLIPFIIFIFGILVDHFANVVSFFVSLFR